MGTLVGHRHRVETLPERLERRANFTTGELAVLKIVADECLAHGVCDLSRNEIRSRAGGRGNFCDQASPMEGWMTITKQDIHAALADLATRYPQTFVLEKYQPHRPLKVGIAADLRERCPAVERRVLSVALSVYARRVMYLRGLVAGATRVDLDGNPAGEVTLGMRNMPRPSSPGYWHRVRPRPWQPRAGSGV
jgi:ProQ/FINO family